jgi:putative glutathione S-transferase
MLVLNLKGGISEDVIGRSVAHPNYHDLGPDVPNKGWVFDDDEYRNQTTDHKTLRDVYLKSDPDYMGKWTVPCLFDTQTGKVVNNESSDIMALLNDQFNHFATHRNINLRPSHLEKETNVLLIGSI